MLTVLYIYFLILLIEHIFLWNLSKKNFQHNIMSRIIASTLISTFSLLKICQIYIYVRVCVCVMFIFLFWWLNHLYKCIFVLNALNFKIWFYLPIRSKHFCFILLLVGWVCYVITVGGGTCFYSFFLFFLHLMIHVWCCSEIIEIVWMFLSANISSEKHTTI